MMQITELQFRNILYRLSRRLFVFLILALLLVCAAGRIVPGAAAQGTTEFVVGVPANFPPEYFTDAQGKPYGFAIDVMNEIAQRSGVQVRYVVYANFADVTAALRDGQIDLIPIFGITDERKALVDFTAPVETFQIRIFVRSTTVDINTLAELSGRTVAVVSENQGQVMMAQRSDIDLLVYLSPEEALLALISGNADALVYPDAPLLHIARQSGLDTRIKAVGGTLAEIKRAIGVSKGLPELYNKLDAAVQAFVLTPQYRDVYSKWYGAPAPFWDTRRVLTVVAFALALAALLFLVLHYMATLRLSRKLAKSLAEAERAQSALRRWAHIFERAQWGVAVSSADGKTLEMMNPAFAAMHGFSVEELTGRPLVDVYAPAVRGEWAEQMRIADASGHHTFESIHLRQDGSRFPVLMDVTAVKDAKGEFLYWVANCQDITARKRAEQELVQLKKAVDASGEVIFMTDREGVITFVNPEFTHLYGYTAAEVVGKVTPRILKSGVMKPDSYELFWKTLLNRQVVKGTLVNKTKDDRLLTVEGSVNPILDEQKQIVGFLAIQRDISARERAAAALRESEERFRKIFEEAPIGIVLTSRDLQFFSANPAFCQMLGYVEDEMGSRTFLDVTHPDHRETDSEAVEKMWQGKLPDYRTEKRYVAKNGAIRWGSLATSLIQGQDGNPLYALAMVEDITERKRAEEALRQHLAELEALHIVSSALRTADNNDAALPILLDQSLAALNTDVGVIWLYRPEYDELRAAVARGWFREISATPLQPDEGIVGRVFRNGQTYRSPEFQTDQIVPVATRERVPPGWGGVCMAIHSGAETVGVLFVAAPTTRPITSAQVRLLESLVEMGGAAMQRMSLFEETVRRLAHMQALHTIDSAITSTLDLSHTLDVVLEQTTAQLGMDAASVLLLDPHTQSLVYAAGRGFRTPIAESGNVPVGADFAGRAILAHRIIHIDDPGQIENPHFADLWAGEGFAAYYAAPLIARERVIGVLEVFRRTPSVGDEEWEAFLATLAGQAAIAVDNAHLQEELQVYTTGLEDRVAERTAQLEVTNEELREANEEVVRALGQEKELNELKSRFLSVTSHEFRTPLSVILSSAQLLERYGERLAAEKKESHLQRIQSSVQRMVALVDGVLVVEQGRVGRLQFNPKPVDLVHFCQDLDEEFRLGIGAQHQLLLTFEGVDAASSLVLEMDEGLLQHILRNLLSNAIKYSAPGSQVHLSVAYNGQRVRFTVADQGIGIPAQDQTRLFESFHRASNVGVISGTGLGLSIVKQAVDRHGGSIQVQSQEGEGTTFTVEIPLPAE